MYHLSRGIEKISIFTSEEKRKLSLKDLKGPRADKQFFQ